MSDKWHEDPRDVPIEGLNDTCIVCGHSYDSKEHSKDCINSPPDKSGNDWTGRYVEDLEPYAKWDLIAWPKVGFTGDEFEQFFKRYETPHIGGHPMKIGYVKSIRSHTLEVIEAEPSRFGEPSIDRWDRHHPDIIQKEDVAAKKQREYNQRFQEYDEEQKQKRAETKAQIKWHRLAPHIRWAYFLAGQKQNWIKQRAEEIRKDD